MPYIGLSVKYWKKKKGHAKYLPSSNPHVKEQEAGRQGQNCVRWRCISTLLTRGVSLVDSSQSFQGMYCTAQESRHTPSGRLILPLQYLHVQFKALAAFLRAMFGM